MVIAKSQSRHKSLIEDLEKALDVEQHKTLKFSLGIEYYWNTIDNGPNSMHRVELKQTQMTRTLFQQYSIEFGYSS
jgi:hypothetical protein